VFYVQKEKREKERERDVRFLSQVSATDSKPYKDVNLFIA
jgi:hypothetical protein